MFYWSLGWPPHAVCTPGGPEHPTPTPNRQWQNAFFAPTTAAGAGRTMSWRQGGPARNSSLSLDPNGLGVGRCGVQGVRTACEGHPSDQ